MKSIQNKLFLCITLAIGVFAFSSCEVDEDQQVVNHFNTLVFEDNFDVDGQPNPQYWSYDLTNTGPGGLTGWGNGELQYYTSNTENVKVENGYLLITAQEESIEGFNYTSARLKTENLFESQYGRFEARMRLPYGQGLWPAFWLLGNDCGTNTWPACGEIDIFEYKISNPIASNMAATVHGPGYSGGESISVDYDLDNNRFDSEFHVFGAEWTANHINFYVDGDLFGQITKEEVEQEGEWVFDHPFYMILNLAVGGFGQPAPSNLEFPQTMLVDYVRVYQ